MHIFPQLREMERKYDKELAVVGVHSAKFPAEQETENIRKSVLRYDLEHPVVNDRDFLVWKQYTVRAWPTLMFVDPVGKVIGKHGRTAHSMRVLLSAAATIQGKKAVLEILE